mmetsp:Transcript_23476/g.35641  ORF Transcript_23476/g.35641 Transcript_23476/m.35641 type:complete len:206 (+) Transcript_23476:2116-2733(+)
MITLAFFFLHRPREYTSTTSNSTLFCLRDMQLFVNATRIDHLQAPQHQLSSATFGSLEFTKQKNGVGGEVIGLGATTDPLLCPVHALSRRARHLRSHSAPSDTPLGLYYDNGAPHLVLPTSILATLQAVVSTFSPFELGFTARDVTARSLCADGAMALLCAGVYTNIAQLIGCWRSDSMLLDTFTCKQNRSCMTSPSACWLEITA